jgi:hypothetical protein
VIPFKKAALGIGILLVLAGIAGLIGRHDFKLEVKAIPPRRPIYGGYLMEAGGVGLHVPIGYIGSFFPTGRDAVLTTVRGDYSQEMYAQEKVREGIMNFWLQNEEARRLGGKRMRELMGRRFTEKSFRYVGDRPRSMAGQGGVCSEYSISYDGEVTYGTRLGIVCTFGQDEYADFEGTLPSAADFYQVIESALPLQRKN